MPIYLKLGDIKGEALEASHSGWIEVLSVSTAMARKREDAARTVTERLGSLFVGNLELTKKLDKSSVKLAESCASGSMFSEVEVHMTAPIGTIEQVLFKLILNDVLVASHSFHVLSPGGGSQDYSEMLSLSYFAVKWVYVNFDSKTVRPMGQVEAHYSLKQE